MTLSWSCDPVDYRFLEVNPAFERQTGLSNATGHTMRELAPEHEQHWFDLYGRIAVNGEPLRFINRAEQLHRWYEVYAWRFGDPQDRQVAVLFNDITERTVTEMKLRQGEERLRAFISATTDVVYRMNADWSEMTQLHGRQFIDDTFEPSRSWLEKYIHPHDRPNVLTAIRAAIETKSIFELEHRVIRVDGTLGWTHSRAIPILDEHGGVIEWFGAATDVTQRKQAQEALELHRHELEETI